MLTVTSERSPLCHSNRHTTLFQSEGGGGGGWGGGGTLIFSHIRRLGLFFGFKILNFNIFCGFRKMNIFRGYEDLWIFFGVITKLG